MRRFLLWGSGLLAAAIFGGLIGDNPRCPWLVLGCLWRSARLRLHTLMVR
jgi:hypothetical protein